MSRAVSGKLLVNSFSSESLVYESQETENDNFMALCVKQGLKCDDPPCKGVTSLAATNKGICGGNVGVRSDTLENK